MSFFVTLQSNFQHVMMYESPELQQKARSHIPHLQLSSAAELKLKEVTEVDPGVNPITHLRHFCICMQINQLTCFYRL